VRDRLIGGTGAPPLHENAPHTGLMGRRCYPLRPASGRAISLRAKS
jgi:hypothetical protein